VQKNASERPRPIAPKINEHGAVNTDVMHYTDNEHACIELNIASVF
jgi:hypothetical protein